MPEINVICIKPVRAILYTGTVENMREIHAWKYLGHKHVHFAWRSASIYSPLNDKPDIYITYDGGTTCRGSPGDYVVMCEHFPEGVRFIEPTDFKRHYRVEEN